MKREYLARLLTMDRLRGSTILCRSQFRSSGESRRWNVGMLIEQYIRGVLRLGAGGAVNIAVGFLGETYLRRPQRWAHWADVQSNA